jgi:DNA polymerase (family X)
MKANPARTKAAKQLRAPLHNTEIADRLDDIATMLELGGANQFRIRAYVNASRLLRRQGREVSEMIAGGADLDELPGVGKDLAGKIAELCTTGTTPLLRELKTSTPTVALELMQIPGLGPKRIMTLIGALHIHTVEQLRRAALDGRIKGLAGFGPKLEQVLLETLKARTLKSTRVKLAVAANAASPLLAYLQSCPGVLKAVVGGSYRRGQETVGDLDIVCAAKPQADAIGWFIKYPEFATVESAGSTRVTAHLRSGLQVDLRVVEPDCFGAALHYFTGSKAHNIAIRTIGRARGLKINEYGVFKGKRRIGGETEDEVFAAVGLPYIAPELRENRGEIEAAEAGALPNLITVADLKGDLHVHSDYTDGTQPIRAMALAAKARGRAYIAITDHSRRMSMTHGLDPARLRRQGVEIDRLNASDTGLHVLKGIEMDILPDGTLDLPDSSLDELDVVIGAVHTNFHFSRAEQTERIEKALSSGRVDILAHPTGRILGTREPYDVDMARIVRAAAAHSVALEINAQPDRLDLTDVYARMAKEAGALLAIGSDAHAEQDYDNLSYGVAQARRGWIEAKDVLNTMPFAKLRHWLAARRAAHVPQTRRRPARATF